MQVDFQFICRAIEKWLAENDGNCVDVTIYRRVNDPLYYGKRVDILLKTNCCWDDYTGVKKEFEAFLNRILSRGFGFHYPYQLTILHTKKIAA